MSLRTFSQRLPKLADRVAIVTGSAGGIGRATAIRYASESCKLVVCSDLRPNPRPGGFEDDAKPTHELINSLFGQGRAVFQETDVTNSESVKETVAEAVKAGGRLDMYVLINKPR